MPKRMSTEGMSARISLYFIFPLFFECKVNKYEKCHHLPKAVPVLNGFLVRIIAKDKTL